MSHFFGRRFVSSTSTDGYGVSDHGDLTGLYPDDDHPQYLITTAVRTEASPTSGIIKTDLGAGDVFSLTNAGSGAALFIRQTGNTTNADAALDIDNSDNSGRGLSVFSTTAVPLLPLVQFSALDESFDEPVLLITHANPSGLGIKVLGDGYLSGHLLGPQSVQFTSLNYNPVDIGETGIYVEGEPGIFYFVDKDGRRYTFGDVNLLEGDGIDIRDIDGLTEISVDVSDLYGTGLGTEVGFDGYLNLRLDADASMISYDDTDNTFVIGNTVQEALDAIDGYFQRSCDIVRIHKLGSAAVDAPFNSVYTLDGYTYDVGQNKLVVAINGLVQNTPTDYVEFSESAIEFSDPLDDDDEIDIIILPCGIGASMTSGSSGGADDTLQTAYDNSPSGAKNINENDGQITITQLSASGSVLRLISNSSLTTALNVDQAGSGTGITVKSVDETNSSLLIQKDAPSRNSIKNSVIVERTTSHVSGGLTGIGSAILTRLESTGTNLFSASRIITGTESAADSIEDTFLAVELSNDGILQENLRLTSIGNLGLGTTSPNDFKLQVAGNVGPDSDNIFDLGSSSLRWKDGYFGPGSIHIGTGRVFVSEEDNELYFRQNNTSFNLLSPTRLLEFEIDSSTLEDGYALTFNATTNTLEFKDPTEGFSIDIPDPFTPIDGTWNVVGNISVRGSSGGTSSEQFGEGALAAGTLSVAVGALASASADNTTVVGYDAEATSSGSVAIGRIAQASGFGNIAVGQAARAGGNGGTAVGDNANAGFTNTGSTPFGVSTAIGGNAIATGGQSVAIGQSSSATGQGGVAIGRGTSSGTGDFNTAVGRASRTNTSGVARASVFGFLSVSDSSDGISIGANSSVGTTAIGSIAIGSGTTVGNGGAGSIAIGFGATTNTFANALALGNGAQAFSNNQGTIGLPNIPIDLLIFGNLGLGISPVAVQTFKLEIAGGVGPNVDDAYGIGSPSNRWRDGYFSNDLYVSSKVRSGINKIYASINIPILSADPLIFDDGDIWITDIEDVKKIKVRIGESTYSTTLTLEI